MAGKLEDRVAIVTGAGRGVGLGVARLMAAEGAKVVVADNGSAVDGRGGDAGPAEQAVEEIRAAGGEAIAQVVDVSDWASAEAMVNFAIETWGKLDILVNIAGNFMVNTVADAEEDDCDLMVKVHTGGMMATSHFAAKHWVECGEYGRLINTTSDSAMSGVPDTYGYAAAKAGIIGLTRAAANALAAYNVTANMLTQGSSTRMGDDYSKERAEAYFKEHGRWPHEDAPPQMRPENVAPLLVYLASPAGANISGRIFGAYGYKYILWSEPVHERTLESDGPWDLDRLFEDFPKTLGEGLTLADLPHRMENIQEKAGAALQRGRPLS